MKNEIERPGVDQEMSLWIRGSRRIVSLQITDCLKKEKGDEFYLIQKP